MELVFCFCSKLTQCRCSAVETVAISTLLSAATLPVIVLVAQLLWRR